MEVAPDLIHADVITLRTEQIVISSSARLAVATLREKHAYEMFVVEARSR